MDGTTYLTGTVVSRRELNPVLWVVRLRPDRKIAFQPGQYVTIGLPVGDRMIERPYSVASAPHETELEFFLEIAPGGALTPLLYQIPVGGSCFIRPAAKGLLLFDSKSGHPNHFLAGTVTGAAPFISMVRDMAAREAAGEKIPYHLVVLHGASISQEFGYYEEMTALAARHAWLCYIPTISRPWEDPEWKGERGRCEDVLRKHLDGHGFSHADTTAYFCGNPNMIDQAKGVLHRAGFPKQSIRQEVYWVQE